MDQKHPKNYALYIQISKSTTSQTIHKNLIEIIQNLGLPFIKQIKDFENSTFKFLELPFHSPLKEKEKKVIKCCNVLIIKWLLPISLFIINHHVLQW
jgi:hypothetical protein